MDQQAPAEAGGQPAQEQGGGIVEALTGLDKGLFQITTAVTENPQVPEEAKAAFQSALQAFRKGLEMLTSGGGQPAPSGPVTPEQGVSGAQPMSHGRPG
jgi:hypothetical protein